MEAQQQKSCLVSTPCSKYEQLNQQYLNNGISYKSNQILHKSGAIRGYPYLLLLNAIKVFHMNQFQILFLCHILSEQDNTYQMDPLIFETSMSMQQVNNVFDKLQKNSEGLVKIHKIQKKTQNQQQNEEESEENVKKEQNQVDQIIQEDQLSYNRGRKNEQNFIYWSIKDIKKLYMYFLVVGYSVKYYLNQSTKPYQDFLKHKYPQFFTNIFVVWVDKYSSKVLRTNPKKINQFYLDLFQSQQKTSLDSGQIDCQYRNYNQIVEQLIKATSDIDDNAIGHIEDPGQFDN